MTHRALLLAAALVLLLAAGASSAARLRYNHEGVSLGPALLQLRADPVPGQAAANAELAQQARNEAVEQKHAEATKQPEQVAQDPEQAAQKRLEQEQAGGPAAQQGQQAGGPGQRLQQQAAGDPAQQQQKAAQQAEQAEQAAQKRADEAAGKDMVAPQQREAKQTLGEREEEQIAQQQSTKKHSRVSDRWGIPTSLPGAQAGPDRVFSKPACAVCKSLVTEVAKTVRDKQLSKYDAVVEAQAECWRGSDSQLLGVECGDFHTIEEWLEHAELLRPGKESAGVEAVDVELALQDPQPFCERVNLCGKEHTDVLGPNAAVVRMRFRRRLQDLAPGAARMGQFVRAFLGDLASALGVSRSRLEFHLHRGDELHPEVAIRPARASDVPVPNPNAEMVVRSRGLSPLALGRNLRDMVAAKHSPLFRPHHTTSLIDPAFAVEVYQLQV